MEPNELGNIRNQVLRLHPRGDPHRHTILKITAVRFEFGPVTTGVAIRLIVADTEVHHSTLIRMIAEAASKSSLLTDIGSFMNLSMIALASTWAFRMF